MSGGGLDQTGAQQRQRLAPGTGDGGEGSLHAHLFDANLFKIPGYRFAKEAHLHISPPVAHQLQGGSGAAGPAPEHSKTTSAPSPSLRSATTFCGSSLGAARGLVRAQAPRQCQPRPVRLGTDHHRLRAGGLDHLKHQQADGARSGDDS